MAEGLEQRRHQFAPNQVAGAAKQDKIKGHGDELHESGRCTVTLFQG
jgi:hypothetical protein